MALLPLYASAYDYSAEEGKWVGRIKLGASIIDSTEQEFVSGVPVNRTPAGLKIFDTSVIGEIEDDYFLFDHFSIGASLGYIPQDAKTMTFNGRETTGKITAIPIAATAKVHIAPYGEVRPYITTGYHYTFFSTSHDTFKFDNTSGPLLGGGLDWWLSKSWGINLEAKQYFMETEVDRSQFTLDNSITKVEINPLIMSAGIAYRF
jgi:outer membrane protein